MSLTRNKHWTDDDLLALPDDGKYELVDGELVHMSPAGGRHGKVSTEPSSRILSFVKEHRLGHVFDGQTGFRFSNAGLTRRRASIVSS